MLAYLDRLLDALTVRDTAEAERLLAHPLARVLTDAARDEAVAVIVGRADALAAPLRLMQLRHQTAQLLLDAPVADQPERPLTADPVVRVSVPATPPARATRRAQMELPLSA